MTASGGSRVDGHVRVTGDWLDTLHDNMYGKINFYLRSGFLTKKSIIKYVQIEGSK